MTPGRRRPSRFPWWRPGVPFAWHGPVREPIRRRLALSRRPRSPGEGAHMDAGQGGQRAAGTITIEREATDRWVLCLRGDVDTAVATHFTSSQGRQRVVVDAIDAADVTFISSSGVALMLLCIEASIAAGRHPVLRARPSAPAGRHPVLRAASRPVDRALQLSGIETVFPRPEPVEQPPEPEGGTAEPG